MCVYPKGPQRVIFNIKSQINFNTFNTFNLDYAIGIELPKSNTITSISSTFSNVPLISNIDSPQDFLVQIE